MINRLRAREELEKQREQRPLPGGEMHVLNLGKLSLGRDGDRYGVGEIPV